MNAIDCQLRTLLETTEKCHIDRDTLVKIIQIVVEKCCHPIDKELNGKQLKKSIDDILLQELFAKSTIASERKCAIAAQQKEMDTLATWQYHPLPEDDPDPHSEYDDRLLRTSDNSTLMGARVRGKKHKHDGTNCDDWFEFSASGNWTIIAVSDGAGSKKFSRLGAKVSCQAAVRYLEATLQAHKLEKRENWSKETFDRDKETGQFSEADLETVQKALHGAMKAAYEAVTETTRDRAQYTRYYKSLEHRDLDISDLSATLLLAVCTVVNYKDKDYSFVMTCQVGDGTIAAIDSNDRTAILSHPDRGEFAGQTEFLTTEGKIETDNLMRKTFPFFRPLKALFVMTDGVADDYFPTESKMLELYGDLLLNGAIAFSYPKPEEIEAAIANTQLGTLQGVEEAKSNFEETIDRLTSPEDEIQKPVSPLFHKLLTIAFHNGE